MVSKTTVAPLDRVKILLQAHNLHHKNHGMFGGMKHIIMREGPLALYKVRFSLSFKTQQHCQRIIFSKG